MRERGGEGLYIRKREISALLQNEMLLGILYGNMHYFIPIYICNLESVTWRGNCKSRTILSKKIIARFRELNLAFTKVLKTNYQSSGDEKPW